MKKAHGPMYPNAYAITETRPGSGTGRPNTTRGDPAFHDYPAATSKEVQAPMYTSLTRPGAEHRHRHLGLTCALPQFGGA